MSDSQFGGIAITAEEGDNGSPTIPPPAGPGPEPDTQPDIPTETDGPALTI